MERHLLRGWGPNVEQVRRASKSIDDDRRLQENRDLIISGFAAEDSSIRIAWTEPGTGLNANTVVVPYPILQWEHRVRFNGVKDWTTRLAHGGQFTGRPVEVEHGGARRGKHVKVIGPAESRGGLLADLTFAGFSLSVESSDNKRLALDILRVVSLDDFLHLELETTSKLGSVVRAARHHDDLTFHAVGFGEFANEEWVE